MDNLLGIVQALGILKEIVLRRSHCEVRQSELGSHWARSLGPLCAEDDFGSLNSLSM